MRVETRGTAGVCGSTALRAYGNTPHGGVCGDGVKSAPITTRAVPDSPNTATVANAVRKARVRRRTYIVCELGHVRPMVGWVDPGGSPAHQSADR